MRWRVCTGTDSKKVVAEYEDHPTVTNDKIIPTTPWRFRKTFAAERIIRGSMQYPSMLIVL